MKRRLFNIMALASVAASLAVSALWVRSYFAADVLFLEERWQGPRVDERSKSVLVFYDQHYPQLSRSRDTFWKDTRYELHVSRGRIAAATFRDWGEPGHLARGPQLEYVRTGRRLGHESAGSTDLPVMLSITGTTFTGSANRQMTRTIQPGYPLWPALLLALPMPLLWVNDARRRRRRLKQGRCSGCGYDLRASPHHCPECGRTTPAG
jgi:hypothetical protein